MARYNGHDAVVAAISSKIDEFKEVVNERLTSLKVDVARLQESSYNKDNVCKTQIARLSNLEKTTNLLTNDLSRIKGFAVGASSLSVILGILAALIAFFKF